MAGLYERTLADLAAHPGTTAGQIADRTGANSHIVFQVLERAEHDGLAQRTREGTKAWRWEPVPAEDADGRSYLHVGPGPDRHEHAWSGQVLRHTHPGGGQPHGYYGHPEEEWT